MQKLPPIPPQDEPCSKASPSSKAAADKKVIDLPYTAERRLLLCVCPVGLPMRTDTEIQTAPSTAAQFPVGVGSQAHFGISNGNTELFPHCSR